MSTEAIKLSQLSNQIKAALSSNFSEPIWVVAEVHEMQINRNGHCYMELVEKSPDDDKLLAKIRATIWSYTFRILRPYFESTTGYQFSSGIKVMFKVSIVYHELYGTSLNVTDIDPNYTLGDIARRRQEIINQLQEDGVIELNKELEFPEMAQRIAIISSPSAAGYGDFYGQLHHNEHGFVFYTVLFSAIMQGKEAEASIIAALERIYEHEEHFDAVVIIRGGGSKSDLAAFDSYELSVNMAQFPLPILTGIGHDRDESVADIVAHKSLKTPTAVAEFLIDGIQNIAVDVNTLEQDLISTSSEFVNKQKERVERIFSKLSPLVNNLLNNEKSKLDRLSINLQHASKSFLQTYHKTTYQLGKHLQLATSKKLSKENERLAQQNYKLKIQSLNLVDKEKNRLELLANSIKHLDPQKLLDRGFSVTFVDGKPICSIQNIKKGKIIVTRVSDGEIESEVL